MKGMEGIIQGNERDHQGNDCDQAMSLLNVQCMNADDEVLCNQQQQLIHNETNIDVS